MSPRRSSLPPPLPPLRARPGSPLRFRSGRDRPACSLPPPAPGGGFNTIRKPSEPSTPAPPSSLPPPLPPLAPVRTLPFALARVEIGRTARCPLPLPAGAFNHINSYHWKQLLCVCPTLTRTIFFSFARSFTWSHASLRFGLGPGERPRKGFAAAHTIKAIVNNS